TLGSLDGSASKHRRAGAFQTSPELRVGPSHSLADRIRAADSLKKGGPPNPNGLHPTTISSVVMRPNEACCRALEGRLSPQQEGESPCWPLTKAPPGRIPERTVAPLFPSTHRCMKAYGA